MSRLLLFIGVVLSVAIHALLLSASAPEPAPYVEVVPMLESVVARADPSAEPESVEAASEPASEPSSRPPRPQPHRTNEPSPEPAPESAQPATDHSPTPPRPPRPAAPRPTPGLVETTAAPHADESGPGDFAGTSDGRTWPALRIDWGSTGRALATIDAGAMRVVVLQGAPPAIAIVDELTRSGAAWERRAYGPSAGSLRYSNHLRIVDDVPAFRELRSSARLRADERLAVLLPVDVERRLQSAQIAAAFERGLTMDRIRDFAGLFLLEGDELAFEITHVEESQ